MKHALLLRSLVLAISGTGIPHSAGALTTPPADFTLTGELGGDEDSFGWSVAPAGDVNGDAIPDLIVGAPSNDFIAGFAGRAYLFHGPFTGDRSAAAADAIISAEAFGDNLGIAVASAGDVNRDGFGDLLIGARGQDAPAIQAGRVYLFHGPVSGHLSAPQADAMFSGSEFEELGGEVASGDLDGDGASDLLLGGPRFGGGSDRGRTYVFYSPVIGQHFSSEADAIINGELNDDNLGRAIAAADINHDGIDDLILGAPKFPLDFLDPGRAYLFYGPIFGEMSAAAADVVFRGEASNDMFGTDVAAGDMNGDGLADIIVGADQLFNDGAGKAYLFLAPFESTPIPAANANGRFVGEVANDNFGHAVASAGDVNGDGKDEVLVGAWDSQAGASRGGRAYLFLGPATGLIPAGAADLIMSGVIPGLRLGQSVAGAGDLNQNGRDDILVGGPQFLEGEPGRAFIYLDHVVTTGIAAGAQPAAGGVLLAQNFPNPFGPRTVIGYRLDTGGRVRLAIYDVNGRRVRTLVNGAESAGARTAAWDGRDDGGAPVARGTYFYRLESAGRDETRRMVLTR